MITADYDGTKEYRDELASSLKVARQRLSARDFQRLAIGIEREIARLDLELSEYYGVLFPHTSLNPCVIWSPEFSIKSTPIIRNNQSFSIRFPNSPSEATCPWTSRIQEFQFPLWSAPEAPCALSV